MYQTSHKQNKFSWAQTGLFYLMCLSVVGCDWLNSPGKPQKAVTPKTSKITQKAPPEAKPKTQRQLDHTLVKAQSKDLPRTPGRIISLAPNLTEIVFALGAGDRLVGVTKFCDHPVKAKALPKVGGFIDPDMEVIASAKPDLILGMASGPKSTLPTKLDKMSLRYVFLQMKTIEETYKGIELVGQAIGKKDDALALVKSMKASMKVKQPEAKPKALFVLGHRPMIVAGPGSFGAQLIELAGGQNAVSGNNPYPALDIEKVIALQPDVIVDATMTAKDKSAEHFWQKYSVLKAVKAKRVHTLHDPSLLRPGPRLPDALKTMHTMIQK